MTCLGGSSGDPRTSEGTTAPAQDVLGDFYGDIHLQLELHPLRLETLKLVGRLVSLVIRAALKSASWWGLTPSRNPQVATEPLSQESPMAPTIWFSLPVYSSPQKDRKVYFTRLPFLAGFDFSLLRSWVL